MDDRVSFPHLSNDDSAGLQVDVLVLDAHEDDPVKTALHYWVHHGVGVKQPQDHLLDLVPVLKDLLQVLLLLLGSEGGPLIVVLKIVVPRHLVHPHRHHGLHSEKGD